MSISQGEIYYTNVLNDMKYTLQLDRTRRKKKDVSKSTNDFILTFNAIIKCTLNEVDIGIFLLLLVQEIRNRREEKKTTVNGPSLSLTFVKIFFFIHKNNRSLLPLKIDRRHRYCFSFNNFSISFYQISNTYFA